MEKNLWLVLSVSIPVGIEDESKYNFITGKIGVVVRMDRMLYDPFMKARSNLYRI